MLFFFSKDSLPERFLWLNVQDANMLELEKKKVDKNLPTSSNMNNIDNESTPETMDIDRDTTPTPKNVDKGKNIAHNYEKDDNELTPKPLILDEEGESSKSGSS